MTRTDNKDGGFTLVAKGGMDLAVLDESSNVIARAKEVLIPAAGTLNAWMEVSEEVSQPTDSDPEKEARIAALKAELAKLQKN